MVKFKGKTLSEELWKNEKARNYVISGIEKDFNLEKEIDRTNESRP